MPDTRTAAELLAAADGHDEGEKLWASMAKEGTFEQKCQALDRSIDHRLHAEHLRRKAAHRHRMDAFRVDARAVESN